MTWSELVSHPDVLGNWILPVATIVALGSLVATIRSLRRRESQEKYWVGFVLLLAGIGTPLCFVPEPNNLSWLPFTALAGVSAIAGMVVRPQRIARREQRLMQS